MEISWAVPLSGTLLCLVDYSSGDLSVSASWFSARDVSSDGWTDSFKVWSTAETSVMPIEGTLCRDTECDVTVHG